jgi:hypothetical protein
MPTCSEEGAAHQRDQHEDQFTGVHVAEQPHAVRDRLGDELDHLHREVEGVQAQWLPKGAENSLVDPAAQRP